MNVVWCGMGRFLHGLRGVLRRSRSLSRGFDSPGQRPHRISSCHFWICGSLDLPQSSLPLRTPQSPLLLESSTAVSQVLCKSVIRLFFSVGLSLSSFPQQGPCAPASAGSIGRSRPCPNQTMTIAIFVDSFIQVLVLSWAMMLTHSCLHTRSSDHSSHQWSGHISAALVLALVLAFSFSKSCYLTLAVKGGHLTSSLMFINQHFQPHTKGYKVRLHTVEPRWLSLVFLG